MCNCHNCCAAGYKRGGRSTHVYACKFRVAVVQWVLVIGEWGVSFLNIFLSCFRQWKYNARDDADMEAEIYMCKPPLPPLLVQQARDSLRAKAYAALKKWEAENEVVDGKNSPKLTQDHDSDSDEEEDGLIEGDSSSEGEGGRGTREKQLVLYDEKPEQVYSGLPKGGVWRRAVEFLPPRQISLFGRRKQGTNLTNEDRYDDETVDTLSEAYLFNLSSDESEGDEKAMLGSPQSGARLRAKQQRLMAEHRRRQPQSHKRNCDLWKRAAGPTPLDVGQGLLPNCFFVAAVSALAEDPSRIRALFANKILSKTGMYVVVLWVDGAWRHVSVSDQIYCRGGEVNADVVQGGEAANAYVYHVTESMKKIEPWFSNSKDTCKLWPLLLEKAYCKLLYGGDYSKFAVGGQVHNVLHALTGMPTGRISLSGVKRSFSDDDLFQLLVRMLVDQGGGGGAAGGKNNFTYYNEAVDESDSDEEEEEGEKEDAEDDGDDDEDEEEEDLEEEETDDEEDRGGQLTRRMLSRGSVESSSDDEEVATPRRNLVVPPRQVTSPSTRKAAPAKARVKASRTPAKRMSKAKSRAAAAVAAKKALSSAVARLRGERKPKAAPQFDLSNTRGIVCANVVELPFLTEFLCPTACYSVFRGCCLTPVATCCRRKVPMCFDCGYSFYEIFYYLLKLLFTLLWLPVYPVYACLSDLYNRCSTGLTPTHAYSILDIEEVPTNCVCSLASGQAPLCCCSCCCECCACCKQDAMRLGGKTGGKRPPHPWSYTADAATGAQGLVRLVKLRNPWGTGMWHGAFSKNSFYWSKEARRHMKPEEGSEDGAFWMRLVDFKRYFSSVSVAPYEMAMARRKSRKTIILEN